jgi:hypothetical protein
MNKSFDQALAELTPEEVGFVLVRVMAKKSAEPETRTETPPASLNAEPGEDAETRRRRHVEREWPEVGTILKSEYYGTTYTAEVITATKKLKSGKQIQLTSGPALGVIADSFSEAMLLATDEQRTRQSLGRKGASNGWIFWDWPGKPANIAGDGDDDGEEDGA